MDNKPYINNKEITLKPKKKIRRKNKHTKLQELYEEGKVRTEEFYKELLTFIKWRLMTDLIKRGYFINGVRQSNFTRDECDSCYTHVLSKILNGYSPEKGTLATYIRWQIRGWGTLIVQKQFKEYKYAPHGVVSIESSPQGTIKSEELRELFTYAPYESKNSLNYYFCDNCTVYDLAKSDIEKIRENIETINLSGALENGWIKD